MEGAGVKNGKTILLQRMTLKLSCYISKILLLVLNYPIMAISDWPESERPRERLLKNGAEHLTDAELLAIFLRTGIAGKSAVDLARELLLNFKGLTGLFAADQGSFCKVPGMGLLNMRNYRRYLRWPGGRLGKR